MVVIVELVKEKMHLIEVRICKFREPQEIQQMGFITRRPFHHDTVRQKWARIDDQNWLPSS